MGLFWVPKNAENVVLSHPLDQEFWRAHIAIWSHIINNVVQIFDSHNSLFQILRLQALLNKFKLKNVGFLEGLCLGHSSHFKTSNGNYNLLKYVLLLNFLQMLIVTVINGLLDNCIHKFTSHFCYKVFMQQIRWHWEECNEVAERGEGQLLPISCLSVANDVIYQIIPAIVPKLVDKVQEFLGKVL